MRPAWRGSWLARPRSGEQEYVGEASFRPGDAALLGSGWKYIRTDAGHEELYDLEADPQERSNRCPASADCPRLRERLMGRVAAHRERAEQLTAPEAADIDADTLEDLKALGYLDPGPE